MEQKKGNGINWILDEDKVHTPGQLRKLRKTVQREKEKALASHRKVAVKDWFVVETGAETGLRVQEMADLSCGDLKVFAGQSSVVVRSGKGGKRRIVLVRMEFCQAAREFLQWKQRQGDSIDEDAPVFSVKGRRMTKRALQKSYNRSRTKARITQVKGVGVHSLRHTYATFLMKASNDNITLIQWQLGHADRRITETYQHLFGTDVRKSVGRLYR